MASPNLMSSDEEDKIGPDDATPSGLFDNIVGVAAAAQSSSSLIMPPPQFVDAPTDVKQQQTILCSAQEEFRELKKTTAYLTAQISNLNEILEQSQQQEEIKTCTCVAALPDLKKFNRLAIALSVYIEQLNIFLKHYQVSCNCKH